MNTYGNRMDIMKKGYLIHKKHTKVYVILCAPLSISDVSTVYYSIFGGSGNGTYLFLSIYFILFEYIYLL